MRILTSRLTYAIVVALAAAGTLPLSGQAPAMAPPTSRAVTAPAQELGQNLGDDYFLANYQQLTAYWKKLDGESDRMQVVDIGATGWNRRQLMAIVTAPANFARLDRYKEISRRLSLAQGLTDDQARELAREGKSVVWIDGGLHASEVLGAQQLMETVYQLVSRNDEETRRILNDVIVLLVNANPDGQDLHADNYMKHYGDGGVPVLYERYAGHDNNRDSFMNATPETTNMSHQMYREWFPQIMYNHHQTGPGGSVMFAPPFRDPHNYNFHPLVPAGIEMVASAMHTRFIAEGKPGVVSKAGASYSTWWNGGLRTTAYFHNQIGILTETIGSPTPGQQIPFNARFQVANSSSFYPIKPQEWKFRNSVDYSVTANYAILDLASRYRELFLYRIYKMGSDQIKWGSEDHWTHTPHEITKIEAALAARGGGAGFSGADAFSDIFGDVFGDIFGGGRRGGRNQVFRGADLRYELELTLEQAVAGDSVTLDIPAQVECTRCTGKGAEPGSQPITCKACGGAGQVRIAQGFFSIQQTCPTCGGAGATIDKPCRDCNGRGRMRKNKTLSVKVPAGVDNGDRIRLAREGEAGRNGGPAGDLYVDITVQAHPIFTREGQNLSCEVPVSFATAALGGSVEVPTLDGNVTLKVPAETQSGSLFRLRGKGVRSVRESGVGDLFCRVQIETPVNLTSEQREKLRAFDAAIQNEGGRHSPRARSWFDGVKEFFERMGA